MPKENQRRKSRQDDYAEFKECDSKSRGGGVSNLLQMTAELVPKFSGRDNTYPVTRWIDDIESNAEIFSWTPLQQLLVARSSLTGTAELWLRAERPFKSWEELKAALLREFPDSVDVKAIHELMSARKKRANESCLDYMLVMKELGKRGKMADYVAIKYIVDGIIDVETNKMMLYGVTSYSDLKEKLKIYETITNKMYNAAAARRSKEVIASTSKQQLERRRIRCYACGEFGHSSSDCPHKSKGLKCFRCNDFGHVGSACPGASTAARTAAKPASYSRRGSSGDVENARQGPQTKRAMFAADFTRDNSASRGNEEKTTEQDCQLYENDVASVSLIDSSAPYCCQLKKNDDATKMAAFVDNEPSMSLSQQEKKPVITIKLNDVQLKALVDSGSDVNIISVNVYNAIGKPVCEKDEPYRVLDYQQCVLSENADYV